jgi:hypothetical protein
VKQLTFQELTKLADAAFKQATRKVIRRARETGTPVIVWADGQVRAVDPRDLANGAKPAKRRQKNRRRRD